MTKKDFCKFLDEWREYNNCCDTMCNAVGLNNDDSIFNHFSDVYIDLLINAMVEVPIDKEEFYKIGDMMLNHLFDISNSEFETDEALYDYLNQHYSYRI